jgi:hypothetical protein
MTHEQSFTLATISMSNMQQFRENKNEQEDKKLLGIFSRR